MKQIINLILIISFLAIPFGFVKAHSQEKIDELKLQEKKEECLQQENIWYNGNEWDNKNFEGCYSSNLWELNWSGISRIYPKKIIKHFISRQLHFAQP
jgi:hypothetical protein